ncbi:MAG TPA: hypothetical protein VFR25_07140 [Candidatus Eisenbacteria bacterium]|nr:hypothetical protein [Candidatus Eisenbacteria bacterium]
MRTSSRRAIVGGLVAACATLAALLAGCTREAPDVHEARLAAERYIDALAHKDLKEIRARSTCVASYQSLQGGNVLQIGDLHHVTVATIDSLGRAAGEAHRSADSGWGGAPDSIRDELSKRAMAIARLHFVYRSALRALSLSRPDSLLGSNAVLDTRTLRVRVRYAGEAVGPRAIDKEVLLRLIRAPGGQWIAFSFYSTEDDPRPERV